MIINRSLFHYGGDIAIGASGIFNTYASLMCMIVVGICQGMQPIIGYNYGAGVSTAITTFGSVFALTCPELIARAFTVDQQLIATTVEALSLVMLVFSVVGFQIVSTTFFQSIGQAGKSIFLSLTRQVIFLIPLLLILPRYLGLKGVWLSFPSSDIIATLVTAGLMIWQFRHLNASHTLE